MSQSILLRGARQLLTLRGKPGVRRGSDFGNLEIIEDGSVFIQNGKIACVGSTRRLENLKEIRGALVIPVQNCIVMPGFVDAAMQLSLTEANPHGSSRPKRRKLSNFHDESVALMRACLQHGTLNVGIKASSGIHSLGADLSLLRQLIRVGNSPVGMTRIWSPATDLEDMPNATTLASAFEMVSKRKLADSVELKGVFDEEMLAAANKANLRTSLDWTGGRADALEESLERSRPESVYCHRKVSTGERAVLSKMRATAVFSAGGDILNGNSDDSIRRLLDEGGAIALGSGYDAQYAPNFNMQLVLGLAVHRLSLTIEQAIVATTINAAYAMNCGDQIGSLEPGKQAEVLVLNLSDYREIPRRLGVNHVAMAIHEGNLVLNRTRWRVGAA